MRDSVVVKRSYRWAASLFLLVVCFAIALAADPAVAGASQSTSAPVAKLGKAKRDPAPVLKPTGAVNVYLIRGFLGVFSLGMDKLNRQLRAEGIPTKIMGHLSWSSVVDEIVAEAARRPKGRFPLVIVGHSFGANAALMLAYKLGEKGVPVDLVVTVDPTVSRPVTSSVKRYLNIYQSGNGLGEALDAKGVNPKAVDNDNARTNAALNRPGITHFTMDENDLVQRQILTAIEKVVRR